MSVPFLGEFQKIAPATRPPLRAPRARRRNGENSVTGSPIRCPPLVAPNETVAIPPTSLPKSSVIDEFVPESRVGCPDSTFCGLATDPEVPCTATGRTVRDVGDRLSASIAPGGAATAASTAGSGCGPSWAEDGGTAEKLASPSTSRALARPAARGDGPRMETSRIGAVLCLTPHEKAACCSIASMAPGGLGSRSHVHEACGALLPRGVGLAAVERAG